MPAKTNPVITVWDHKAHLDLLQAVLAVARPDTDEWNMIIASVQQKGYRYSASAAQYVSLSFRFCSRCFPCCSP